ncbi:Phage protein [Labilithrix luteola]|uniref:Phage protein n=1 Tax=Labilithrix luteola TaxID=1391654 RepID=A0A0K1PIH5_9BACT|nr:hypothetical protein [Labilithrix luteola]AKU93348.1 hypothetical protein AKJ09_00012 [Labilithrix luteola]AKU93416.1 Phage protein [Labilithrix luteola]
MMTTDCILALFKNDNDGYEDFLSEVQKHFDAAVADPTVKLFTTDAAGLWDAYLDNAPPGERQHRNCNCCRQFIERFGGLVTIAEYGFTKSVMWPDGLRVPALYHGAVTAMQRIVTRANVTGVFRACEINWGTPQTGKWRHIAVKTPKHLRSLSRVTTPFQEMAAKREEYEMLLRALGEFPLKTVTHAYNMLTNGQLFRAEKCVGVARWLFDLHNEINAAHGAKLRTSIIWRAVASAPAGYCHVRSGMIGSLLEDIQAGLPFEAVKRNFEVKMNPLQYLRPQAPPKAGNIAQAEKIVAALRSAGALERRFAKMSDVVALWKPCPRPAPVGGVFGHLARRPDAVTEGVTVTMTWEKFKRTVLPEAEQIEYLVPREACSYTAMVTAKDPSAPNMLQWDNPVSYYVYSNGSMPADWNLRSGEWAKVNAVVMRSWMWDESKSYDHLGAGAVFVLEGCKDRKYIRGAGMFPEHMRSEYHPIRRTLEAHFNQAVIAGRHEAEVCGVVLCKGSSFGWSRLFRVTSRGMRTTYKLDRWD